MPNQTPFFQAFGPLLFGRPARAALERLKKLDSLQELHAIRSGGIGEDRFVSREHNPIAKRFRQPPMHESGHSY